MNTPDKAIEALSPAAFLLFSPPFFFSPSFSPPLPSFFSSLLPFLLLPSSFPLFSLPPSSFPSLFPFLSSFSSFPPSSLPFFLLLPPPSSS
ncbi:hypothetical protein ACXWRW_10025, partial [Streptococcus pyogenes]